jgi:gamma-glutamyltranspeptidase
MAAIAAQFPDTPSVFLPSGRPPGAGFKLRQSGLARTLRTIQAEGAAAFYRGSIARAIVGASDRGGGLFSERDLAEQRVLDPIQATYRGWTVLEQPTVSQGLIVLIALKILEGQEPRATRTRRTSAWSTRHATWSPIFTVPNRLAPGKRPVHTLNSWMLLQDGTPQVVGGTPGLFWQVQTNLQLVSNLIDLGMRLEARFRESVRRSLRERGHTVQPTGDWAARGHRPGHPDPRWDAHGSSAIRDPARAASSATEALRREMLVFAECRCYKSQVTAAGPHPHEPRANSASSIRGRKNASEEEILD